MAEPSWFDTGKGAVDRANQKSSGFAASRRFYMKTGSEAAIIFLDGDNTDAEPIGSFREHAYVTKDGKWPNFCTCPGPKDCTTFCKGGIRPYDGWPFTIIQVSPVYKDRDGKEHFNERKLLISKKEAMQKILRHLSHRKGLVGTVWNIFRSSDRSYTIGDDWQFDRKIGGDVQMPPQARRELISKELSLPPEGVLPLVYREILKPKDENDLVFEGVDIEATKRKNSWTSDRNGQGGGQAARGGPAKGSDAGAEVKY
jgi:hypothetical protein